MDKLKIMQENKVKYGAKQPKTEVTEKEKLKKITFRVGQEPKMTGKHCS